MQQVPSVLSSREAARIIDVDATTIQRAIARGELNASRPRDRAPYRIQRSDLLAWAAANGYAAVNGSGQHVDAATGEVLESEAPAEASTPIAAATAARARLAGVVPGRVTIEPLVEVSEPPIGNGRLVTNVERVLLPSADAGLLEAARRLVQLPESPELWQALRAVLGAGA